MGEPKPFASLSSGLLARKGQARPAMRPQGFGSMVGLTQSHDDLGWNDMGEDHGPAAAQPPVAPVAPVAPLVPVVLQQREQLADRVEAEDTIVAQIAPSEDIVDDAHDRAVTAPASVPNAGQTLRAAAGRSGKAAFTLRLPADRHLRLRLACAVRHRSAQQLVTEALDRLLDTIPEVEELARQLPDPAAQLAKGE